MGAGDGELDGSDVVGMGLGSDVGVIDGSGDGAALGAGVGAGVGVAVGDGVGAGVGVALGAGVGVALGEGVGAGVLRGVRPRQSFRRFAVRSRGAAVGGESRPRRGVPRGYSERVDRRGPATGCATWMFRGGGSSELHLEEAPFFW